MNKRLLVIWGISILSGFLGLTYLADVQAFGVKKKRPKLHEYGNVLINNFSAKEKIGPVVFKHWLHRSMYTCRLCHVDIGFAMQAGETGITEKYNNDGFYCGTCHNGKEAFGPQETNRAGETVSNCNRCHSHGKVVEFKYEFYAFRKQFPPERFGNGIDWLTAEEQNLVNIKDRLGEISSRASKIKDPKKFELSGGEPTMPDIIFSHKKHTVWNGCDLCHPDIFIVKKGYAPYSMQDIFAGRYCGVCHGTVAFPNLDCRRCHAKPVI